MRQHIGIVGGGFKPFTSGHFFLVQQAANDADKVYLLVSTSNRERKGELPIFWNEQMEDIWDKFLQKAMPSNVEVIYVKNPTGSTYEILGDANNDEGDDNTYILYGDETDVGRYYSDDKLQKYFPRLMQNDQIERKGFSRSDNIDISGTQMRDYIVKGDVEGFTSGLPRPVQRYGQEIFDKLAKSIPMIKMPKPKKKKAAPKKKS